MKRFTVFVFILLVAFTTFQPSSADEAIAKSIALPYPPGGFGGICQYGNCPSMYYNSCTVSLTPDIAVIKGGISVEGKEPVEAKKELDKKIKKLKSFVDDLSSKKQKAEVDLRGTLRGAVRGMPKSPKNKLNHMIGESIEIRLPVKSEIDSLLEKLPEFGMRFGARWMQQNNSQPTAVVMYRFKDVKDTFEKTLNSCKEKAWEQWCRTQRNNMYASFCAMGFKKVAKQLNITNANLYAQNVLNEQFYPSGLSLTYPWQPAQLDKLKSADSGTIHFHGNVNMQLVPVFGEGQE